MDIDVFAAVIAAAAFQAGWNFFTKSFTGDRGILLVLGWAIIGLLLIPIGIVSSDMNAVPASAGWIVLGSGVIHSVYVMLLSWSWSKAPFHWSEDIDRTAAISIHQPIFLPLFCSSSHFISGSKYAIIAEPSIWRLPVKASSASGQGSEEPIASILFKRSPTALLP